MKYTKNKTSQSILKKVFTLITLVVLTSPSISRGNSVERVSDRHNAFEPGQREDERYKEFCINFIRSLDGYREYITNCINQLEKVRPSFLDINIARFIFVSNLSRYSDIRLKYALYFASNFSFDAAAYKKVCKGSEKDIFGSRKVCSSVDSIRFFQYAKRFDPYTLNLEPTYSGALDAALDADGKFDVYSEGTSTQNNTGKITVESHNQGSECGDSVPDSGSSM